MEQGGCSFYQNLLLFFRGFEWFEVWGFNGMDDFIEAGCKLFTEKRKSYLQPKPLNVQKEYYIINGNLGKVGKN